MSAVFADTFYWIALTDPLDATHERASRFTGNIVTTEEVLAEYLNFFCAAPEHLRRKVAIGVEAILADPGIRVIPPRMQAMRREGLTEVLTNDRHFEQEGFRALFR